MAEEKVKEIESKVATEEKTIEAKPSYVYIVIQRVFENFDIKQVFSTKGKMEKAYPNLKGKNSDCDRNKNGLLVFREKIN